MKSNQRLKRAARFRLKYYKNPSKERICVFRSCKHLYVQLISKNQKCVLAAANTLNRNLPLNKVTAMLLGKEIATKALKHGVNEVVFDKSGYKYHGKIQALATAAREAGLKF